MHEDATTVAVLARLDKLERQNRRLKQAGAVALVMAAALMAIGQVQQPGIVRAREFLLVDGAGNYHARLGFASASEPSSVAGDPIFEMSRSPAGRGMPSTRIRPGSLEAFGQAGSFYFFGSAKGCAGDASNEAPCTRFVIDEYTGSHKQSNSISAILTSKGPEISLTAPDGSFSLASTSGLSMWDRAGKSSVQLVGGETPFLGLGRSGDSELPSALLVGGGTSPSLALYSNKIRTVQIDGAHTPSIMVTDDSGFNAVLGNEDLEQKATGTTMHTSAAFLGLFDKDGKILWSTPH